METVFILLAFALGYVAGWHKGRASVKKVLMPLFGEVIEGSRPPSKDPGWKNRHK